MAVHSALMKELARRGHQVTVFSTFPEKYPIQNLTDIEFKLTYPELQQKLGEHKFTPLEMVKVILK
jgi:nucleoside-diphosphate-sugar epimerase